MRRLSFVLRSCVSPWIVLPVIGLSIANWMQRNRTFLGEGMWTVEWAAIAIPLIGIFVAGGAAVDAARFTTPGRYHVALTARHPSRLWLMLFSAATVPAICVHIAGIAVHLALGGVRNPSVGWIAMIMAVIVQCLGLLWFGAIGLLIGRYFRPAAAGVLAASAAFGAFYIFSTYGRPRFGLLSLGGATIPRIGLTWNAGFLALQALLFGATIALAILLPSRGTTTGLAPTRMGSVALSAVVIVPILASQFSPWVQRNVVGAQELPQTCDGVAPRICYYGEHTAFGAAAAPQIRRLVEAARRAGYDAFSYPVINESSATAANRTATSASFPMLSSYLDDHSINDEELVRALVLPTHCPGLYAAQPPSEAFWSQVDNLTATWLALVEHPASPPASSPSSPAGAVRLSPAQALATVQQVQGCRW